MTDVIRQDLFEIPKDFACSFGYVILKKQIWDEDSLYLEQVLISKSIEAATSSVTSIPNTIFNSQLYDAIEDGDVGFINSRGTIRVVLSKKANHNTLLVTEQCDNLCLFCSQPPKARDDHWLFIQAGLAVAAFQSSEPIGISGGEPLLNKELFVRFLDTVSEFSPQTPLHILTNGRSFSDSKFTCEVSKRCEDLSLTFGIPLYSSLPSQHDTLVGSNGAYSETVKGLINAGNSGIPIELRFIPTQLNICQLENTIEMATRCFSSLVQISIMNLEPTGWAKKNWNRLVSYPQDHLNSLQRAIDTAHRANVPAYLFNYPLCHLNESTKPYATKSISDWKNYYPDECNGCIAKEECTGYFASSKGFMHQPARRII